MIFIENPEMENIIAVYNDNEKWGLIFIRQGEDLWFPTRWATKNDKKLNKHYMIPIEEVPKGVLRNLMKIPFVQMDEIENFRNILSKG